MVQAVQSTIQFPYKRSLGPVVGAFMTALTDRRIIGIRSGERVIVPPREWDPDTGEQSQSLTGHTQGVYSVVFSPDSRHLARVMSLTIRLYANMFAGDLVTLAFFSMIPILLPVPFLLLHVGVSLLQTYIFLLLTTVYLAGAVAEEH